MDFSRPRGIARVALLLVAAGVVWFMDRRHPQQPAASGNAPVPPSGSPAEAPSGPTREGRYDKFVNCRLFEHRQNDGDSFRVQLPAGRVEQFRLYFVDCPESAFRNYGGNANNTDRIDDQARYFSITPEQAVEIGKKAEEHTLGLLRQRPFTVFTDWEDPYGDHRFLAFVEFGSQQWLQEDLVREGLVRIHTKPAELPDGTSIRDHLRKLHELENEAKAARRGAWALSSR
jgi:endonuclease YncB( thermonuclease family)